MHQLSEAHPSSGVQEGLAGAMHAWVEKEQELG